MPKPIERLRPTLAEWERGNFAAGADLLSPAVVLHSFLPGGMVVSRGLEEVTAHLRDDVFAQWDRYRIEVRRLTAIGGEGVLMEGRQHGVGKRSGIETADSLCIVFRFRGGRVSEMVWHPDRAEALKAAGLAAPAPVQDLGTLVASALAEDVGGRDLTAEAVVPQGARARARIVQKRPGVVFGLDAVAETLRQCGVEDLDRLVVEGQWRRQVPAQVALASGPAAALLAAERTALNFLGHLSGVATLTARFVEAVAGSGVRILDTRKTTPGMRALEKAAVAAGGGLNHRMGLYDAILIKENHIALAGGLERAVAEAKATAMPVEVECRDLEEVEAGLAAGADRLLLDNMSPQQLRRAVEQRDAAGSRAALEASGGVELETVGELAATGVDFISVGALTHSAPALDFSLLVEPA